MDAATIEEANRLRISMGMKPLPVPGASQAATTEQGSDGSGSDSEGLGSTLEKREARAYDNYQKLQDAEESKKKREQKAAAIKKARDQAQRYTVLEGKGLGDLEDEGEVDTKAWIKGHKKRQKKNDEDRRREEKKSAEAAAAAAAADYTAKDLAGVKVSHDMSGLLDGSEQVLTLKDATVLENEEEGDELEGVELREREKLDERLKLKKKRPLYDPNDIDETGERRILSQYDEAISGKEKKTLTLNAEGMIADLDRLPEEVRPNGSAQRIQIDLPQDTQPSDYLDVSEIKVKKPKKKKKSSSRHRILDEDDSLLPADTGADSAETPSMDVDSVAVSLPKKRKAMDDTFVDDDDLQKFLALQRRDALKKRKRNRPEDIAKQMREESDAENDTEGLQAGGLVIDETSGFVDTLRKPGQDEDQRPVRKAPQPTAAAESDEDEEMADGSFAGEESGMREGSPSEEVTGNGVEEEKTIGAGLGQAVQLLRERKLIGDGGGANLNGDYRHKQQFLAEKERRMATIAEETRSRRERDRASGRMDRMSVREREDWQRQQNSYQDQQTSRMMMGLFEQQYKPSVELKYTDEFGRRLDQKEAFKHLSHMFHGKGSGKGKTDKRLKKIEDEKRRESQSVLDASQNVGMSSATAQQLKKRNEAGVRLA